MSMLPKAIYRFNVISIKIDTNGIFHKTRANIPKIYMEPQKTLNCHSKEKEEQSSRNHATWYQTILQDHSNQNSMVLA